MDEYSSMTQQGCVKRQGKEKKKQIINSKFQDFCYFNPMCFNDRKKKHFIAN